MTREELQSVAVAAAFNHGLDPALVCSVCAHESSWNAEVVRYEPSFFHRYIESMKGLSDEEKQLRATSIGLFQVMGQVAREQGFDEPSLKGLFNPMVNAVHGCRKLRSCIQRESSDLNAALLRWNGGGNANYPSLVMKHYPDYAYLNAITRKGNP